MILIFVGNDNNGTKLSAGLNNITIKATCDFGIIAMKSAMGYGKAKEKPICTV